jgi:hypothetical protein
MKIGLKIIEIIDDAERFSIIIVKMAIINIFLKFIMICEAKIHEVLNFKLNNAIL